MVVDKDIKRYFKLKEYINKMNMVAEKIVLTKGVGRHKEKLVSFEMALRDAKIAHFNLVRVSSIFPANCKIIPRSKGLNKMQAGQIVFCVLSDTASNELNRLVSSSVGIAIPQDSSKHGYLSEHHCFGKTESQCGDYAEDLAAEMLATVLGLDFDPDQSYDIKRDVWKMSDQIVTTTNVTQSAVVKKDGEWVSVVAGAIFVMDPAQ